MWKAIGKDKIEIEASYSNIEFEIYTGWSGETTKSSLSVLSSNEEKNNKAVNKYFIVLLALDHLEGS